MQISTHITALLYRYDCVIIPDFGAFISKRIPADLNKEGNVITPPRKHLLFNEQITNNDGLLTNYISVVENIEFETSKRYVSQFVKDLRKAIADRNSFDLPKIGNFSANEEGKLAFKPDTKVNYLTESFGLDIVAASETERDTVAIVEETIEEEVLATREQTVVVTERKSSHIGVKYAASIALVAGMGYVIWNQNNSNEVNQYTEASKLVQERIQEASFSFDVKSPLPSITLNVTKKAKKEQETPFHIIAGAFRDKKNADKLISRLKVKGFKTSYLGTNKFGLHQVAYQSFSNKKQAVSFLNKIKKEENKTAWILTK